MFTGKVERWRECYPPNPAMLRQILFREGYTPYQWVERNGIEYGFHTHGEEQIHWVISGELEITVMDFGREFKYVLQKGDRDYIPPGIRHRFRVVGDSQLFYLNGIKQQIVPEEVIEVTEIIEKIEVISAPAKVRKPRAKSKTKAKKTATNKKQK